MGDMERSAKEPAETTGLLKLRGLQSRLLGARKPVPYQRKARRPAPRLERMIVQSEWSNEELIEMFEESRPFTSLYVQSRIHAESLALREIAPKYGSEAAKAVYAHLQNRGLQS